MATSKELLKAVRQGATPHEMSYGGNILEGRTVEYEPRSKGDRNPWKVTRELASGTYS